VAGRRKHHPSGYIKRMEFNERIIHNQLIEKDVVTYFKRKIGNENVVKEYWILFSQSCDYEEYHPLEYYAV
jgi:hypothetical protein